MLQQLLRSAVNVIALCAGMLALAAPLARSQPAATPNALYLAKPIGDCGPPAARKMFQLAGPSGGFMAGGMVIQMGPGSKEAPVTGHPYSAIGTTETVQTLADGNRIVHTNTTQYFRDSKGRTRTEYTLSAVGPFTLDTARKLVLIDDPTSGQRYILHPELKRAESLPLPAKVTIGTANVQGAATTMTATAHASGPALPGPAACNGDEPPAPTSVSLGQQTIEGLKATGTRFEHTIPAGEIGNELPMTISSEQWLSDELGVVLSSAQHDPMIGETTYRLEHITRSDPDPALFSVPSDYVIEEPPAGKQLKFIQRAAPGPATSSEPK
jgi:hypothetical protein